MTEMSFLKIMKAYIFVKHRMWNPIWKPRRGHENLAVGS